MYNLRQKVRIFFEEICVFFVYYIVPNKKERQSLTSLTLNEVQNIPLLPISGVPTLLTLAIGQIAPSHHSVKGSIRNMQLLLDLLRAQHRVESIRQIVLTKVFYLIATHSASSYLLPSLLLLVCSKARVRQRF